MTAHQVITKSKTKAVGSAEKNEEVTILYVGGPLDGTTAVRSRNGWAMYRDDEGHTVPTTEGHAEEARMHGPEHPRKYYRLIDDTYVWLPILGKWLRGHIKEAP